MARRGGRGRRGGRRRSRRRSTRSKASSSRKRSTSRTRNRRSTARGQGNKTRRRVKSVKRAATKRKAKKTNTRSGQGNRSKGFGRAKGTVTRKSVRKGIRSVRKAVGRVARGIGKSLKGRAANAAGTATSRRSRLRRQLSNLKTDVQQKSTKEARSNRRHDRFKRQLGLDTRDMRNMKINVNVDRAAKHYGLDTNRFTKGLYGSLPKAVKNFRFNAELGGKFRSPHKLGVREGYRKPTQGGRNQTIAANTMNQLASLRGGSLRADPSQDISRMYDNLLGRKADQEGLDYWTNEFTSGKSDMEGIRRAMLASEEFKGRSDADRNAVYDRLDSRAGRAKGLPNESVLKEIMRKRQAEGKPAPDIDTTEGYLDFYKPENQKKIIGGNKGLPPDFTPMPSPDINLMEPPRKQEDWLGSFYRDFNIGGAGGKLDDGARNYWSGEAKTKGRRATMDTIRATAKKQGTWGGRSRSKKKKKSTRGNDPDVRSLLPVGGSQR